MGDLSIFSQLCFRNYHLILFALAYSNVLFSLQSLNEALENYNVPIEIVDGFVGSISVTIPWSALINDSTVVEIRNLELTVQPKQRTDQPGIYKLTNCSNS